MKDINETYTLRRLLGEGAFGKVYEAQHKQAESLCAVKSIAKSKLAEHKVYQDLMWSELDTLDKHEHPHIVSVLDLCEDSDHIYIVLELMRHGNLEENLRRIKETGASFTERDCANVI